MHHDLLERARWLEKHILPYELSLRRYLSKRHLPFDLDIDDIIQESYARITELNSVNNIQNPKFYFFQVARSIILSYVRRSKVISIEAVEDIDQYCSLSDEITLETQVSDHEQLIQILQIIARLPTPNRDAFIFRIFYGLSHREIGGRLNMSENAVQKSVTKSLKYIMAAFGEGDNEISVSYIQKSSVRKKGE